MIKDLKTLEVWFVTGSQHLYGAETLAKVAEHSAEIVSGLNNYAQMPLRVVWKDTVKSAEEITAVCKAANDCGLCIGIIAWMHTFSPAKMWIAGLQLLQKPLVHLHTQFNRDIPWERIDMDFMNLNQSAHGDREFGFMVSRLGKARKVIVGYWQDGAVLCELSDWCRVAAGWHEMQTMKVVRFGDNMRYVAVTEGDKVEAQMKFGYSVNTHGVGDLVAVIEQISEAEVDALVAEYSLEYRLVKKDGQKGDAFERNVREAARIELGLLRFMERHGYSAFTDTFEDLHGLQQLPGIAAQRLMARGYGFAGEGDWKTAAMLRVMKVMALGLPGGNSFMEDYTYHMDPADPMVLGAHMLEICPSIAAFGVKPRLEVHPLGIGGKADPARLVFDGAKGNALNVSVVDMGNRFRMIVNQVEAVAPDFDLPQLPVARVLWKPLPDFKTALQAWILAGGAHHTVYSQNILVSMLTDFAEMVGIECLVIDKDTRIKDFKKDLKQVSYA